MRQTNYSSKTIIYRLVGGATLRVFYITLTWKCCRLIDYNVVTKAKHSQNADTSEVTREEICSKAGDTKMTIKATGVHRIVAEL